MLQASSNGHLDLTSLGLHDAPEQDESWWEGEESEFSAELMADALDMDLGSLFALNSDEPAITDGCELDWIEAQLETELALIHGECLEDARGTSIYEKLVEFGLLRKITDIVMAKVSVPWHLREDARQEVHMAWCALRAKENFERNQVAHYAYLAGQHAALKLRRTIGAVVVIPGALFRSGRDTAFMEAIGAAVSPKDVEDFSDSMEIATEPDDALVMSRMTASFFDVRVAGLELTSKQREAAYGVLVEQRSLREVAQSMEMPLQYVERLVTQVTNKLIAFDQSVAEKAACAKAKAAGRGAASRVGARRSGTDARRPTASRRAGSPGSTMPARPAKPRKRRLVAREESTLPRTARESLS